MQRRFFSFALIALTLAAARADLDMNQNLARSVLTPELAERILGVEVNAENATQEPDKTFGKMRVSHCSYRTTGKKKAYIDLVLRQAEDSNAATQQFEGAKEVYHGKDIAGVGDAAFQPTMVRQLHVRKGRFYVVVSAETPERTPGLNESAATQILQRLY